MSNTTGKAWLDVTQPRLRGLFDFDADAGLLIWRVRPVEDFAKLGDWKSWNTRFAGTVAGYVNGEGYRLTSIDGTQWTAHRLIWIYVNGSIPDGMEIDHINGVRDDNRLSNLRLVTHAENGRNQAAPRNNTSGMSGVNWNKLSRKWRVQIRVGGQKKHLGYFASREDAIAARAKANLEHGFHPGHGKVLAKPYVPATSKAKGSSGVAAIALERQRQVDAEGWTPEHDDDENRGLELGRAAISYILGVAYTQEPKGRKPGWPWPWDLTWWKPSDRRRNLVKAGALIAAEIDRLDRSEAREGGTNG